MSKPFDDVTNDRSPSPSFDDDDRELEAMGYVPSFKREFTNLATVSTLAQRSALMLLMTMLLLDQFCIQYYGECIRHGRVFCTSLTEIIKGLCSSIATTFNTPLLLGGPASVRFTQRLLPHSWLTRRRLSGAGF